MKKRSGTRWTAVFLILALVLIVLGMALAVKACSSLEQASLLLISGMVLVAGIMILLTLLLVQIRKTNRMEQEANKLRLRNEAVEELAHHQRLETIGMLTSSIAHEFNNLLAPIMGYSLMALEQLPPEEEELYDEILEIYNSSRKAKEIISRLSDLSRKNTSTTFHQVSPDELIHKTLAVALTAKPKNVELKLDLNCWDQRILANEIQISQMLLNLVLNGFHAMGEEDGVLTITSSFDEDHIRISVGDTGCGISEKILPKIFDPFFTTKEEGKGTGLGLAIVAQVVEDHQGKIDVKTKAGKGTLMTVSLPRSPEIPQ